MTFVECAERRTEIGSGLLHFGVKPGSTFGLYSVNSRGSWCYPPAWGVFNTEVFSRMLGLRSIGVLQKSRGVASPR